MRKLSYASFVSALALTLTALTFTGCATAGFKKGDATAASIHEANRRLQWESLALQETIVTLKELVYQPAADARPQFEKFDEALDRLVSAAPRADRAIQDVREKSAEYFESWDEELATMDYEVVRHNSVERKIAVSNQVDSVCRRYEETQAVVAPVISYLEDIRGSLRSDLTQEGLESVKPIVSNADEGARKVQIALSQLKAELAASSSRLSSSSMTRPVFKTPQQSKLTETSRPGQTAQAGE